MRIISQYATDTNEAIREAQASKAEIQQLTQLCQKHDAQDFDGLEKRLFAQWSWLDLFSSSLATFLSIPPRDTQAACPVDEFYSSLVHGLDKAIDDFPGAAERKVQSEKQVKQLSQDKAKLLREMEAENEDLEHMINMYDELGAGNIVLLEKQKEQTDDINDLIVEYEKVIDELYRRCTVLRVNIGPRPPRLDT